MKLVKKEIILLLVLLINLIYSQEKFPPQVKLEDILRRANSHPIIEVTKVDKDVIKFENKISGEKSFYQLVRDQKIIEYPNLLIQVGYIDTMLFHNNFRIFKKIRDLILSHTFIQLKRDNYKVLDLNRNSKKDFYLINTKTNWLSCGIYEYDKINSQFIERYAYSDSFLSPYLIEDIDNDGLLEVIGGNINIGHGVVKRGLSTYKQRTKFELPILKLNSIFEPKLFFGYEGRKLYDMDLDNYPELIFYVDSAVDTSFNSSTVISKYNKISQNFEILTKLKHDFYFDEIGGYTIQDFDKNGKIDILYVNSYKSLIEIFEQTDVGSLNFTRKIVDTLNFWVSMHNVSNDIDHNGFLEIWVVEFDILMGLTNIYMYEGINNGAYKRKYWIQIYGDIPLIARGLFPIDIDKDGVEEILFITDFCFYIFKYVGYGNYILDYFQIIDDWRQDRCHFNLYATDIDDDSIPEIFIGTMNHPFISKLNNFGYYETIILKNNHIQSHENSTKKFFDYDIYPNYPNPFNSQTTITFTLPIEDNVEIIINNILGEEVKRYPMGLLNSGKHTINWDGKNNKNQDLPSGIYLINLRTSKFSKTIKSMLIR